MTFDEATMENLRAAGCSEEEIEQMKEMDSERQLQELNRCRRRLLAQVHSSQKRLQDLDYLIFNLRRE